MKTTQDNTIEAVSFIFIILAAIGLTYAGSYAFPAWAGSAAWQRVLAVPMFATVFVFSPELGSGYLVLGWVGGIVAYFGVGLVLLGVAQSWIKKRHATKKDTGTRI